MSQTSKICISGIGLVTPLGEGVEENWNALTDNLQSDDYKIRGFKASDYIKRRYLRPLDDVTIHCISMTAAAMGDSNIDFENIDPATVGLMLGSVFAGIGSIFNFKQTCFESRDNDYVGLSPLYFPGIVFNSLSGQPAIEFGFTGPNSVVNSGLSSGLLAVIKGAEYIQSGKADIIIAGGAEMRHLFIDKKYELRKDEAFAKSMGSNFFVSEATCLFVLHREDDPRFSSANHYGTIDSWRYGYLSKGYSAEGLNKAIKSLPDFDNDSIKTIVMDSCPDSKLFDDEYQAVKNLFPEDGYQLIGNKINFGHTLGASGSLNLFQGLRHAKGKDTGKTLVNSLDADGNYAFMTIS